MIVACRLKTVGLMGDPLRKLDWDLGETSIGGAGIVELAFVQGCLALIKLN